MSCKSQVLKPLEIFRENGASGMNAPVSSNFFVRGLLEIVGDDEVYFYDPSLTPEENAIQVGKRFVPSDLTDRLGPCSAGHNRMFEYTSYSVQVNPYDVKPLFLLLDNHIKDRSLWRFFRYAVPIHGKVENCFYTKNWDTAMRISEALN